MHPLYDLYKLGDHGSAMWMGRVECYDVALFEIELTAATAPGDYLILNEQTGQQDVLSFGLSVDGRVMPIKSRASVGRDARRGNFLAVQYRE